MSAQDTIASLKADMSLAANTGLLTDDGEADIPAPVYRWTQIGVICSDIGGGWYSINIAPQPGQDND